MCTEPTACLAVGLSHVSPPGPWRIQKESLPLPGHLSAPRERHPFWVTELSELGVGDPAPHSSTGP